MPRQRLTGAPLRQKRFAEAAERRKKRIAFLCARIADDKSEIQRLMAMQARIADARARPSAPEDATPY